MSDMLDLLQRRYDELRRCAPISKAAQIEELLGVLAAILRDQENRIARLEAAAGA